LVHEAAARSDRTIVDQVGDAFLLVFPDARAAVRGEDVSSRGR